MEYLTAGVQARLTHAEALVDQGRHAGLFFFAFAVVSRVSRMISVAGSVKAQGNEIGGRTKEERK